MEIEFSSLQMRESFREATQKSIRIYSGHHNDNRLVDMMLSSLCHSHAHGMAHSMGTHANENGERE